ncbi:MAG: hypothetical protein L0Z55_05480, partial [Planctomycetes bacterium]|nr:hypothetical protein [Planctomycetota bacterium]
MKLSLVPKLEQQQILAPQMILSMDILLLNSLDLENRIGKEFMENPALELAEDAAAEEARAADAEAKSAAEANGDRDPEVTKLMEVLDNFESRYGGEEFSGRRAAPSGEDNKLQALQNHADRPAS